MSDKMQVLIEHLTPDEAHVMVSEAVETGAKKSLWIQGTFMQAAVKNHNKRNYPTHEVQRTIQEASEKIKATNGILGELDHPTTLDINLDRVSHVITEYKMSGNDVIGRAKILRGPIDDGGTPMGNIAASIINAGVRLGVSSRGAGSVNASTGDVSNFSLITCDIVATPSAPNAYPKAVMEALEYSKNINQVLSLSEAVLHDPSAQKHLQSEILKAVGALIDKGLMSARKK